MSPEELGKLLRDVQAKPDRPKVSRDDVRAGSRTLVHNLVIMSGQAGGRTISLSRMLASIRKTLGVVTWKVLGGDASVAGGPSRRGRGGGQ